MAEKNLNSLDESKNKELMEEVYRIAEQLKGYCFEEYCFLINNYLKETVKPRDFKENNPEFSTAYAALIQKEANSSGFSKAFSLILNTISRRYHFHSEERRFIYKGETYKFSYLSYVASNGSDVILSPFTEKLCSEWLIEHSKWFNNTFFS